MEMSEKPRSLPEGKRYSQWGKNKTMNLGFKQTYHCTAGRPESTVGKQSCRFGLLTRKQEGHFAVQLHFYTNLK